MAIDVFHDHNTSSYTLVDEKVTCTIDYFKICNRTLSDTAMILKGSAGSQTILTTGLFSVFCITGNLLMQMNPFTSYNKGLFRSINNYFRPYIANYEQNCTSHLQGTPRHFATTDKNHELLKLMREKIRVGQKSP
jgi:hypothetical protein